MFNGHIVIFLRLFVQLYLLPIYEVPTFLKDMQSSNFQTRSPLFYSVNNFSENVNA